ncbi:U3 small nucleolar ribonucleoprotein complex, subunit Mpp10 [Elaphomyces granulatus]
MEMAVSVIGGPQGRATTEYPPNSPGTNILDEVSLTPHSFLLPTNKLYVASLLSAKNYLDPLASSISTSNVGFQKNEKKRKRAERAKKGSKDILQLHQLYLNGFATGQIWEQATRIISRAGKEIEHDIFNVPNLENEPDDKTPPHDDVETHIFKDIPVDNMEQPSINPSESLESEMEAAGQDGILVTDELDEEHKITVDENINLLSDTAHETRLRDPFGLNDGFFSIDDFNKQSELLEKQDARNGETSDDDEFINWDTDPFEPTEDLRSNEDHSSNVSMADLRLTEDEALSTTRIDTNDIKYTDFFLPPIQIGSDGKKYPRPELQSGQDDLQLDPQRVIADVRRDLFEDTGNGDTKFNLTETHDMSRMNISSYEKQTARIGQEIRRLEAANITKKEWMLSGEVKAAERPFNSLIEEDLEFERIGRPVPVVTSETTEEIEEIIKRRVRTKEFDEVTRCLPSSLNTEVAKRGRIELDDTKPQQSLAEIYEIDHRRIVGPYESDKGLKLAHSEINNHWGEISSQLDSLSNWQYKPRIPQASISVITDVATITMEEARPTASQIVDVQGTLAPQEIYVPGNNGRVSGELVLKSGASMARDEETREEHRRRRRRQKAKMKKTSSRVSRKKQKGAEQQQLLSKLKSGGVKIIGARGELKSLGGRKARDTVEIRGSDILKL